MLTTYKEWMGLHTGITIPCMIGAYYEANHSLNLTTPQCLEVILSSILEARIPVKIFRCSDINTDINIPCQRNRYIYIQRYKSSYKPSNLSQ